MDFSRRLEFDEIRCIQLDILKNVHDFCVDNNIRYFMSYGTLLGAVRHKGYIPWDDDIDIVMPRPDYNKFEKIYNEKQSEYKFLTNDIDKDFLYTFGKVCDIKTKIIENINFVSDIGINIDVFPIDGFDEDINFKKQYTLAKLQSKGLYIKYRPGRSLINKILYRIYKMIFTRSTQRMIVRKMIKIAKNTDYDLTDKVIQISTGHKMNKPLDKSVFEEKCLIEFEGNLFFAPQNYDEYLTSLYGDYMQLPPKEKQVTHHTYEAYEREV